MSAGRAPSNSDEAAPAGQKPEGSAPTRTGHRLLTFGRLALLEPNGAEEPSLTTRRRKLALLAYLVLRRKAVPRSVLIDVFWGERDEDRARKSLSDALSHLRRVLGQSLVATYASEIAVIPEGILQVDALEMERAAHAGDHHSVLRLYEGPFLHGVFIEGSTAFEDWSGRERRRFEDMFVASCTAVCRAHARDGNPRLCEDPAERWLEARPASAEAAIFLLNAVNADSTHESRLRALDAYERIRQRLARDYELEPEASVRVLASELEAAVRSHATTIPAPEAPRQASGVDSTGSGLPQLAALVPAAHSAATEEAPPVVPAAAAPVSFTAPRPSRWHLPPRSRTVAIAAGSFLLAIALLAAWPRREQAAALPDVVASERSRRPTVAIAPFVTSADDSVTQWLRDALPSLIAAKLAHFEQLEVIPSEQMRGATPDPVARARRFEARIVASGTITRRDSSLTLDLTLHAGDRRLIARHALQATNVMALADLAAVRVLNAAEVVTEGATLGQIETSNVEAYRRYHLAIEASMAGRLDQLLGHLDAAIALDSGFVSALLTRYRLAVDLGQPAVGERLRPALRRARERMSEGDRLRFDADEALFAGDAARSELLATTLVERYPHSINAYSTYTEIFLNHGKFAKVEAAYAEMFDLIDTAATPGGRALWCGQLSRRAEFRRVIGNTAGGAEDWRRVTEMCPDVAGVWSRYAYALLSAGRLEDAQRAADRARAVNGEEDRWIVGHILLRQRKWEAIDSAIATWRRERPPLAPDDMRDLQSASLRERGRYREAIGLHDEGRRSGGFFLPQVHLDNLARAGDFDRVRAFRAEFVPEAKGVLSMTGDTLVLRGEGARGWVWHRALYGDAIMRAGDTAAVRALADSMPSVGRRSYYARDWRAHHHLRGLLAAKAGRHDEAIDEFKSALWGPNGWTRTNVELARSYLATGRARQAVEILRPAYGANLDAMGRYATQTELDYHMVLAYRALGQHDSAAVYERHVRRAWANADSVVLPLLRALNPD